MSRIRHLIMLLMLFSAFFCQAEEHVVLFVQRTASRIRYVPNDDPRHDAGNQVLRDMAKEVLRQPWLVRVEVISDMALSITRNDGTYRLALSLKNATITGDTAFRKFSVAKALTPVKISLTLRWASRADTSWYSDQRLDNLTFNPSDTLLAALAVAPFSPETDTLMVRDIDYTYDSACLALLHDRMSLIHDYYAAAAILDSLADYLGTIRLDDHSQLPVNYLKAEEIAGMTGRIGMADFPGRLLPPGYDPAGLEKKYGEMLRQSKTLVYNFIDEMHRTGAVPWDGSMRNLSGFIADRVLSYIRRSFLMDYQQGAIYRDCLDHCYDRSAFPPEEAVQQALRLKMFPDALQDTVPRFLARTVHTVFRDQASRLIRENRFAEAYALLENGKCFLVSFPLVQAEPEGDTLQAAAAQGIMESFVGIASSCLAMQKYDMAAAYLARADQYAAVHPAFIRSDTAYRRAFSRLFSMRHADCEQLLTQQRFDEALDCYRLFERAYSARDLAVVGATLEDRKMTAREGLSRLSAQRTEEALKQNSPDSALFYYQKARALAVETQAVSAPPKQLDSLAPVMAKLGYERLASDGARALEKRKYTLAVNTMREAVRLSDSMRIDRSREFDSLYRQAMKYYLVIRLYSAQKAIWANEFDSAEAALRETELAAFNYGVMDDSVFRSATGRFRQRIEEQHCRNLRDSVDLLLIRAGRGIALRNYAGACGNLRLALAGIRTRPACGLADQPVADTLEKYREAAQWQLARAETEALVSSGKYEEAVGSVIANDERFAAGNLGRFGLQRVKPEDLVAAKLNPYLAEQAAILFHEKGDEVRALAMTLEAFRQGLPGGRLNSLQADLGRYFAAGDRKENKTRDPKQMATDHTGYQKGLEPFVKAYQKEWSRLAAEQDGK